MVVQEARQMGQVAIVGLLSCTVMFPSPSIRLDGVTLLLLGRAQLELVLVPGGLEENGRQLLVIAIDLKLLLVAEAGHAAHPVVRQDRLEFLRVRLQQAFLEGLLSLVRHSTG
jgi:hypothetical protein